MSTITPAYLREVADGLANQNSHYERVAARFAASGDMLSALRLALEYWADRQQRYKNRHPVWVQIAHDAIAKAERPQP